MATIDAAPETGASRAVDSSLVTLTHVIYGLHAMSLLVGLLTAATIVGAFLFGIPSIIAVILNYVRRSDTRGTYLESHFRWQIRTFWFAALWFVIAFVLFATILLALLGFLLLGVVAIWVIYRVLRGWLTLNERHAMPA
ncbi:MAG: hypothetical protein EXR39_11650 [Betaproteobacteria bacterium]|nr:hypothetical protein [Betaproteobacteria bacterium]